MMKSNLGSNDSVGVSTELARSPLLGDDDAPCPVSSEDSANGWFRLGGDGIGRVGFVVATSGGSGTGRVGFGGIVLAELLARTDSDPAD